MKTAKEIEELKKHWMKNPIGKIEETKGFEMHKEELKSWRISYEIARAEDAAKELLEKIDFLKSRYQNDPWQALANLDKRVRSLERFKNSLADDGK